MSRSDFTPHAAVAKDKISKNPKNIFFIRVLYPAHPPKVKSSRVTPPLSFHSLAMTKGIKWLIPHSLTTPSQPPTRHVARGPVSCHPSNGGELCLQRERTNAHRHTPGPAQTKFAWVVICGGGGCRAKRDGGWGNTSNKSRATSN